MKELNKKANAGFTLIEVTIGIVLMALIFMGIAFASQNAVKDYVTANRRTDAVVYAQEWIEEKKRLPLTDPFFSGLPKSATEPAKIHEVNFLLDYTLTSVTSLPALNQVRMDVTVRWGEGPVEEQKKITVSAVRSDN